jgi:transposase
MAQGRAFEGGQRAQELYDAGKACNAIARELGVASSTISGWAKREGLSFDRSQVAAANEAHAADLRERRLAIIARLYGRAEKNLERLEAAGYRYRVTFAEGSETVTDDWAPSADERNHSQSIGNYLGAAAKLELQDAGTGDSDAKSLLADLGRALGVVDK